MPAAGTNRSTAESSQPSNPFRSIYLNASEDRYQPCLSRKVLSWFQGVPQGHELLLQKSFDVIPANAGMLVFQEVVAPGPGPDPGSAGVTISMSFAIRSSLWNY
jgi:hypothetical protein